MYSSHLFRHQAALINMVRYHKELPYIFLIGGYGCGKSFTCTMFCLFLISQYIKGPNSINIGVVGVTIKLLRQTVLKDLKIALDRGGILYRDNQQAGIMQVGDYVTFTYLAMENPETIFAHNFNCVLCDELDELPTEKVLEAIKAIQERNRVPLPPPMSREPFVTFTTTAQGLGGTYQLIQRLKDRNLPYAIIRARTADNTSLSPQQVRLLRGLYTEDEARAYLDGEFVNLTTGRVYPTYDRRIHTYTPLKIKPEETLYVGSDFNFGYNASVLCVVRGNCIFVLKGYHWDFVGHMAALLRQEFPDNPIIDIPDASGKEIMSGFVEEFESHKIDIYWNKANPSITERITAINKALMFKQLFICDTQSTKQLRLGLEVRDFDDTGKPRKGKGPEALDHFCFVAGTRVYTDRGSIPIENIQVGDYVLSHDGTYNEVLRVGQRKAPVIRKAGLTGTADHPILDFKLKPVALIDAIEYNILTKGDFLWLNQLYLMELLIGDILTQKEIAIGNTSKQISAINSLKELLSYTETSGSFITDLYLKVTKYTIKMVIQRTTSLPTSRVYHVLNTCLDILTKIRITSFRRKLRSWRLPGTAQKKDTCGILGILSSLYVNVLCAIKSLSLRREKAAGLVTTQETIKEKSSVPAPVLPNITTQSEQVVYNLSVSGTHTYFANGIALHNCDSLEYAVWRIIHGIQGFQKILDAIRAKHHHNELLS